MNRPDFDFLVIGGGISGAAVAAELAAHGRVMMLEAESYPGYHSTGRSAALFTVNYGPPLVRRINQLGQRFMASPTPGFSVPAKPLLTPSGFLTIAAPGQEHLIEARLNDQYVGAEGQVERLDAPAAQALAPVVRPEFIGAGLYEEGVTAIDVAAVHQGFLNKFKHAGGTLLCEQRVESLERVKAIENVKGFWRVHTRRSSYCALNVINAAGAWASQIGQMAGATDIALVPKRRTAMMIKAPELVTAGPLPAIEFLGDEPYLKPEAGQYMASLGEATAVEAQDIQPEDLDIAMIVDWLDKKTLLDTANIGQRWAGLRSFVADGCPVVGLDSRCENFYWLAGQGGYGIMMSEPLARACAGLILSGELPADLLAAGISSADLSADRFSSSPGFSPES